MINRLIMQFHGLERRTARGGRDTIDHGPGQLDDLANAASGALVLLAFDDKRSLIRRSDLLVEVAGWPYRRLAVSICGLDGNKHGRASIVYVARMWTRPSCLLLTMMDAAEWRFAFGDRCWNLRAGVALPVAGCSRHGSGNHALHAQ